MYRDLMHMGTSLECSNQVLDCLIPSNALERHMAITNEQRSYCVQNLGACQESGMNVCNANYQGIMHVHPRSKNVVLESSVCTNVQQHQGSHVEEGDNAGFKKLPRILLLQLDNCGSKNKNWYVFAYLSLLVAKGLFDMVQLGFLMVGHTHEDINALFSHFLEEIRTTQVFSFPHLMQKFNECTQTHLAPFLMQQVPNFKDFVKGYLHEGAYKLVGHSKPLQFRFYMG